MTDITKLRHGTSLCIFGRLDKEDLAAAVALGITAFELSFNEKYYLETIDMTNPAAAAKYGEWAKEAGAELYSIHLPFSRSLDISNCDDAMRDHILDVNAKLIRASAKAGIKVAVLHPSSEPITDENRPERLRRSRDGIERLAAVGAEVGIKIAVENLPRTCLCNRSAEMLSLLTGIENTGIVFDMNHSLIEDNVEFLGALLKSKIPMLSLHISDYDFIDERHRIPGDGNNNWSALLSLLAQADYSGPLMYEVSRQPKERELIKLETLAANMYDLAADKPLDAYRFTE